MVKSIYQQVCDSVAGGFLNPGFSLSSEESGFSKLRFAPGAFDGMCVYHMGRGTLEAEGLEGMATALKAADAGNFPEADALFHEWTEEHRAISHIDDLQEYVIDHAKELNAGNIHRVAVSMVIQSRYIECVKIGLELLELFNEPDESLKEAVRRLGLYDEFTIFSVWNMRKWDNGNAEIFELAKKTHGWGRIHAVERLEPETDEIRHWLLTEGMRNDVVNAYSSLTCWRKSQAERVLFGHPTREEFKGLLALIEGLLDEGPVEGISRLDNAEKVLLRFLEIAPEYPLAVDDYDTILCIRRWAENKTDPFPSVSGACDRIFRAPACASAIRNAVKTGQALRLAEGLGIPFRGQLLECLRKDFDSHCHNVRYLLSDPDYVEPVLSLYREKLSLDEMKGEPLDDPCLGREYEEYNKLQYLIQELDDKPLTGLEFIKAGIESPVTRNRYRALVVLQAWVQKMGVPLSGLLPDIHETVLRLRERGINEGNMKVITPLLGGKTRFSDGDSADNESGKQDMADNMMKENKRREV